MVPGLVGLAMILALLTPAYASPGTATVSGSGTGNVLCGGMLLPATISFSTSSAGGAISGTYNISIPTFSGPLIVISGTINGGKVSTQSYDVTGAEITNSCNPPPFTGSGSTAIEGRCGSGVTVTYEVTEHPSVAAAPSLALLLAHSQSQDPSFP